MRLLRWVAPYRTNPGGRLDRKGCSSFRFSGNLSLPADHCTGNDGRHRRIRMPRTLHRAWTCAPRSSPGVQVVVIDDMPGSCLRRRLSPPYSPAQADLLADAAVADTLRAVSDAPVRTSDRLAPT